MKFKKFIIVLVILFLGYTPIICTETHMDNEEICNEVTNDIAREIQEKFPVSCIGFGGAGLGGMTREIFLAFELIRPLNVEQARVVAVAWTEIFLKNINSSKALRPFLVEYPFPPSCTEFSCHVYEDEKKENSVGSLVVFSMRQGEIRYKFERFSAPMETKHTETYEEAKQIILKELQEKGYTLQDLIPYAQNIIASLPKPVGQSLWKKAKGAAIDAPFSVGNWIFSHIPIPVGKGRPKYRGDEIFVDMRWALDDYGSQIAKKEGLTFYRVSNVTNITKPKPAYFLAFYGSHPKTLQEGRLLASNLAKDFWKTVRICPEVQCYQENMREIYANANNSYYEKIYTEQVNMDQIGFRIAYWDKNVERPQAPYLAEIRFIGGILYYYEADPKTQALRLVLQETYDEATAFLEKQKKPAPTHNDSALDK